MQLALTNAAAGFPVESTQLRGMLEAYYKFLVCCFNARTSLLVRTYRDEIILRMHDIVHSLEQDTLPAERPLLCITIVMFIFRIVNAEIRQLLQRPVPAVGAVLPPRTPLPCGTSSTTSS